MACRQRNELVEPVAKKGRGRDDQRLGPQRFESGEGVVDLGFAARSQDLERDSFCAGCFLRIANDPLARRVVGVDQQRDDPGLGDQLR